MFFNFPGRQKMTQKWCCRSRERERKRAREVEGQMEMRNETKGDNGSARAALETRGLGGMCVGRVSCVAGFGAGVERDNILGFV